MTTIRNLIITVFATLFLAVAAYGQSVTANPTGEGLKVTVADAAGNEKVVDVSPGNTYSVESGFTIIEVSGSGTANLSNGATVSLAAGTTVALTTSSTNGDLGVTATSGSATVSTNTGSETITAGTTNQFVSISATTGNISQPVPVAPAFFTPAPEVTPISPS